MEQGLKHHVFLFINSKTHVVLSKMGGVWPASFMSYRFRWPWSVQLLLFRHSFFQGLIGFERERVLIRQKPLREDRIKTFAFTSPLFLFSISIWFAGIWFVLRLIQIALYLLLYLLYFHPYILVWFFYVQSGSDRQIEIYWDLFSILGRRGLGAVRTRYWLLYYLPTDPQSYIDGQTWWQQGIGIVRPKERENRPKALV